MKDGTLKVCTTFEERKKPFKTFWRKANHGKRKPIINIHLEKNKLLENCHFRMGAGILNVKSLHCSQLLLKTGAGKIQLQEVVSKKTKIKVGMGSLDAHGSSFYNSEIETGMGEVFFAGKLYGKTKIQTGMGEVDLQLIGGQEEYSFDVKLGAGSFKIKDEKHKSKSYNTLQQAPLANHVKVRGGFGNVEVSFP